jgi:hypothetical protein
MTLAQVFKNDTGTGFEQNCTGTGFENGTGTGFEQNDTGTGFNKMALVQCLKKWQWHSV